MKIIFNDVDKKSIDEWLLRDQAGHLTAEDFINYLDTINLDVEMASIRGEYEYWREEGFKK